MRRWVRYAVGWARRGDWLELCKKAALVGIEWHGCVKVHGPMGGRKWLVDDDEGCTVPRGVAKGALSLVALHALRCSSYQWISI